VQWALPGDHLCTLHAAPDEQVRLATAFVRSALGAGDRVLYVANGRDADAIAGLLRDGGVDADAALEAEQLRVLDFEAAYLPEGALVMDEAMARFRAEIACARDEGFPGLRITAEMGTFGSTVPTLGDAVVWEGMASAALRELGAIGMCQYDAGLLGAEAQGALLRAHDALADDDGTRPLASFSATSTPWGIALEGELDVSNADVFARVLRARGADRATVRVDMSGLSFVGVAGLRAVFEAAAALAPGQRLMICGLSEQGRGLLRLLGLRDLRVSVDGA
jgi:anti-anti-sigma factor